MQHDGVSIVLAVSQVFRNNTGSLVDTLRAIAYGSLLQSSRSMRNVSVQGWTCMLYVCVLHVPDGGSNVLPKRKPRRELERLTETKRPGHQILLATAPMRFAANKNFRAGTLRLGLRSFGCGASGHSASLQAVFKSLFRDDG